MSITTSFFTGLSGLDTHAIAMQVIGDNIANLHTTGFKGSSSHFEDVLGVSLSGVTGSNQTGAGAKVSTVDINFIQGSLETTDVATDIAINGKGFFIVSDPLTEEEFYTRAGHFNIDNQGYYVNNLGYRVQGYLYDSDGVNLIETLSDIRIHQNNMIPPRVTSEIEMVLNLDASENALSWDINDPFGSSHFSTAITIFDTIGQAHQIEVYFTKTGDQQWEWHAVIDGNDVQGSTSGEYVLYGEGQMDFDDAGQLTTSMPVDFHTGSIIFYNGLSAPSTDIDFSGTTQYGSASSIQRLYQNGYSAGNVSGIAIDEEGNIMANYTNGIRRNIAQLALADFPNLNGLIRKGGNIFQATTRSGDPLYNKPGIGGMGNICSSMLEESNVDMAAEFIKMIIIQRGYQANTKVITTTDEMLSQLINIR